MESLSWIWIFGGGFCSVDSIKHFLKINFYVNGVLMLSFNKCIIK